MDKNNPNIQRISFEEIQEFKDLDLFELTWEQTNGRRVLLAYDPKSKTFGYSYAEPGSDGGNQNITIFYGFSALIAEALDEEKESARPSINGFDNGDGIIAMSTVGSVKKFDFYDVEISEDAGIDRYVFRMSLNKTITDGKDGYTPVKGVDYFDGITPVKGVDYFDGATPVKGVDYFDGLPAATNLQRVLKYPDNFTGVNYIVTNADNNHELIVDNGDMPVTITVQAGLLDKIGIGFTQKGAADVAYVSAGTTIKTPIGLYIKGQYFQTYLCQEGNTNVFYLGGNTKALGSNGSNAPVNLNSYSEISVGDCATYPQAWTGKFFARAVTPNFLPVNGEIVYNDMALTEPMAVPQSYMVRMRHTENGTVTNFPYTFIVSGQGVISAVTQCVEVPVDTTPPGAPTNFNALSGNVGSVPMTWTASTGDGPVTYEIFRDNTLYATTTDTLFSDNTGDTVARQYKVRARDDSFNYSGFSNIVSMGGAAPQVVVDTTPPTAPVLSVSFSDPTAHITWTESYDAVGVTRYELRAVFDGSPEQLIYNGPSLEYFVDLMPDSYNSFIVVAFDAANNFMGSNEVLKNGANSCFVEGTMITLADGSQVAIETLTLNQLLLSADIETLEDTNNISDLYSWSCNELIESRIQSPISKIGVKKAIKTIILNDGLLEATPEHSQLVKKEGIWKFVAFKDIEEGDYLYNIDGEEIQIMSVVSNFSEKNVYPLTLSPSHTYFANGILTHNLKDAPVEQPV